VLEGAGLVSHESRGTRNLYAVAPDGLAPLQHWLVQTWDTALASFAAYVTDHGAGSAGDPDPHEPHETYEPDEPTTDSQEST
jgi:hypothetical protein